MSKSIYCIKDKRLIIIDENLSISIDIEFFVSKHANSQSVNKFEVYEVKEYYPSTRIKAHRYYQGEQLHGPSTYFYENNQIASKTWYVNGKKQGKSYQYYKNSRIYALQRFKDGLRQDIQKYFYEDGALKSELFYTDDRLDKTMRLYWENGKTKREASFSNGLRHGFDKIFSMDQKLLFVGEYKNGQALGCHKSYDEKGDIREHITYSDKGSERLVYNNFGKLLVHE